MYLITIPFLVDLPCNLYCTGVKMHNIWKFWIWREKKFLSVFLKMLKMFQLFSLLYPKMPALAWASRSRRRQIPWKLPSSSMRLCYTLQISCIFCVSGPSFTFDKSRQGDRNPGPLRGEVVSGMKRLFMGLKPRGPQILGNYFNPLQLKSLQMKAASSPQAERPHRLLWWEQCQLGADAFLGFEVYMFTLFRDCDTLS